MSPELVREGFVEAGLLEPLEDEMRLELTATARPPVMCAGCPHITSYMAVKALDARVMGDIGCYTLAAVEPLKSIDTCVCMGASIGNAIGMAKANTTDRPVVATIGDSTFLHSGIPPLIDAVYNDANITVVILDNKITAMTGGQDHPGTGKTLRGEETHEVNYEELCNSIGVKWVKIVDSYDTGVLFQTLREATDFKGVSVLIAQRPCVLDPVKIKGPTLIVNPATCTACQVCMNLGCPAITWIDELFEDKHKVEINPVSCIGCTLCAQICPSDCIQPLTPQAETTAV
jgi:indolepyruvate ferredoxin oxidoreductase alpha subunit